MVQKERSTRESYPLILSFVKKICHQIRHLSRAFEHNFGPGRREFERMPGEFSGRGEGGGVEAFELIDA